MRLQRTVIPALAIVLAFALLVAEAKDYYSVLGLTKDATEAQIKRAYRRLSIKYHPDKNKGNKEAEQKFVDIAAAHEVLSNPEKRSVYDQYGEEGLKQHEAGGGRGGDPFDLFNMFGFGGGRSQEARTPDVNLPLRVSLKDLYLGRVTEVRFVRHVLCPRHADCTTSCNDCAGPGMRVVTRQLGPGFVQRMEQPDARCVAQGKCWKKNCKHCKHGVTQPEEIPLVVDIPKGDMDGERIVFEGVTDEKIGHHTGNLVLGIVADPHPVFKRKGSSLHMDMEISLHDALVGFKHTIAHIDGHKVEIDKQSVTKPGERMYIKNEGMPIKNSERYGDLVIRFSIAFPDVLSESQKQTIRAILG